MSNISIRNPDISENNKTFINQDYTSGTTLIVDSSSALSNGNYLVIGEPGNEKTEVTHLTASPSGTILTISALTYSHQKGTPVTYLRWDKYSLDYRTSDAGSWLTYGSMPSALLFDSINTEYRDSAATSTYSWRYRYYSTENSVYSDYSDTISASGWAKNTVGFMIRQIRKIINDPDSQTITDTELIRFLNTAQDKIFTLYHKWWFLKKTGTVIDTVASTKAYDLPSDFGRMDRVKFNYVNGSSDITYLLKAVTETEFDYINQDNNAGDDDAIAVYTISPGDSNNAIGYISVSTKGGNAPETAGLDITPIYYKTFTDLDSYGDTTECPIPSMLQDYALSQVFKIRKEEDKASYYDKSFREQIELLKLMQKKQAGQPRSLWNYRGPDPLNKYYGVRSEGLDPDTIAENYW